MLNKPIYMNFFVFGPIEVKMIFIKIMLIENTEMIKNEIIY